MFQTLYETLRTVWRNVTNINLSASPQRIVTSTSLLFLFLFAPSPLLQLNTRILCRRTRALRIACPRSWWFCALLPFVRRFQHVWDSPGRANRRRSKFRRRRRRASSRYYNRKVDDRTIFMKRRNFGVTKSRPSWGKLWFSRRAIRHSSAAQLLLSHTWSERGTANLLGSEISEVLLIAESGAVSLRFQHRVRVLLVFEPRGLYSPLKYVKLTSVSCCTYKTKRIIPIPCNVYLFRNDNVIVSRIVDFIDVRRFSSKFVQVAICYILYAFQKSSFARAVEFNQFTFSIKYDYFNDLYFSGRFIQTPLHVARDQSHARAVCLSLRLCHTA